MTDSEIIDHLLAERAKGNFWAMAQLSQEEKNAAYKMLGLDLIHPRGNVYDILERGYEVIKSGGFDKWEKAKEQRENEIHQATLDSAKATVDAALSARHSRNAAWFSGVFSAIAVLLTFYQLWKGNETGKELSAVIKRVASIDSLIKARLQSLDTNVMKSNQLSSDSTIRKAAQGSMLPMTRSAHQNSGGQKNKKSVMIKAR